MAGSSQPALLRKLLSLVIVLVVTAVLMVFPRSSAQAAENGGISLVGTGLSGISQIALGSASSTFLAVQPPRDKSGQTTTLSTVGFASGQAVSSTRLQGDLGNLSVTPGGDALLSSAGTFADETSSQPDDPSWRLARVSLKDLRPLFDVAVPNLDSYAVSATGRLLALCYTPLEDASNSYWVHTYTDQLKPLDPATGAVTGQAVTVSKRPLPKGATIFRWWNRPVSGLVPTALSADGKYVYGKLIPQMDYTGWLAHFVRVDTATGQIAHDYGAIETAREFIQVSQDGKEVFAITENETTKPVLNRISLDTGRDQTFPLDKALGAGTLEAAAVSADGGTFFLGSQVSAYSISLRTGKARPVPVAYDSSYTVPGQAAAALSADGKVVYLINRQTKSLVAQDLSTGASRSLSQPPGWWEPTMLLPSSDGKRLAMLLEDQSLNKAGGTVYLVDTSRVSTGIPALHAADKKDSQASWALRSPWPVAGLVAAVGLSVLGLIIWRRRLRTTPATAGPESDGEMMPGPPAPAEERDDEAGGDGAELFPPGWL